MCSTIRPCLGAHCFSFLQTWHFWKAPTSSSHGNLILGFARTAAQKFEGPKCARLSARVQTQTRHMEEFVGR